MSRTPHMMLFAGEYSGNIYGAALARALHRQCPSLTMSGTGCKEMATAGVEILYDSSAWGGIGFIEALRVFPRLYRVYKQLKHHILARKPDVLVLIDYPGFNMFLARLASKIGIPTLYYFPPGKFARRPEEVAETARILTRIAAPFRFTYEVYEKAGASVEYVGHPLADVLPSTLTRSEARAALGMPDASVVVGLLPGSRRREIRTHTPMLLDCARAIGREFPQTQFVVPMPDLPGSKLDALRRFVEELAEEEDALSITVRAGQAHETMVAADALLISSGTATLEATWFGTPMVIIYKASWLTEFLARRFFYKRLPDHFGLPNIIAGRLVVPEFIQEHFTLENISGEALHLLGDSQYREKQCEALFALKEELSKPGTSERVAAMALELLDHSTLEK